MKTSDCIGLAVIFTLLSGAFAQYDLMAMSFACFALAVMFGVTLLFKEDKQP
jgi:hypothetical protein